jgi:hypothetical protein
LIALDAMPQPKTVKLSPEATRVAPEFWFPNRNLHLLNASAFL